MTGLRRKMWLVSCVGAGLITIMMIANTMAAEGGDLQPSLEMLEFLLEFDSGDGQWHDPAEIDPDVWQVNAPEQEQETKPLAGATQEPTS